MTFHIITIFPHIFDSYFNESILKRAQKNSLIKIKIYNLRDWTNDKHKTVDDTPYGGGAGMIMKIEPLYKALETIKQEIKKTLKHRNNKTRNQENIKILKQKIILLSAKGKIWDQQLAQKHSKLDDIILICGRYEGIDERITKFVDEEISIGEYVLTGGEIGAMTIVDSIIRLIPGVLGNIQSFIDESHSLPGILEYPQYTRPEIFTVNKKNYRVPKILLSGDHKKVRKWQEEKKLKIKK